MRHPIRVRNLAPALAALAAAGLLTGCLGTEPAPERPAARKAPEAKAAGNTVGATGTACALPVSFALLPDWKPQAVTVSDGDEIAAAFGKQGPATMVCEVDAKPAGNIGFLRVWSAGKGPARAALEGFVKAEKNASKVTFNAIAAGGMDATEATYTVYNKIMEESKEERAFALSTPKGTVIIHLGGLDTQEHREMLPAYELARSSVKAL
ncbi:lipoprotein [Streptomyces sp. NPDC047971]|uniref:lipoprotein n=1 Tax=Streptomyces sp. NPDC047971 TaxID=3154499 RepID=UPI0033F41552